MLLGLTRMFNGTVQAFQILDTESDPNNFTCLPAAAVRSPTKDSFVITSVTSPSVDLFLRLHVALMPGRSALLEATYRMTDSVPRILWGLFRNPKAARF